MQINMVTSVYKQVKEQKFMIIPIDENGLWQSLTNYSD